MYTYHPMQMHLHTCHQPGASMEGHMYNAADLGMHYIRFTDHDVRTGPKEFPCTAFDFSQKSLEISDHPKTTCRWECIGEPNITFDGEGMSIAPSAPDEACGVYFASSGKRHTVSLLADVTLTLGIANTGNPDGRIVLEIRMSQRPPEHIPAVMRYVIGKAGEGELPLTPAPDGTCILKLSADAEKYADGGLDNVFDTLIVRPEGGAVCRLTRFEIASRLGFEDVIRRQRLLADEIGARYGIKPFVTTEISAAGQHKNCFSTCVPVIDYAAHGYKVTQAEAIAHVKKYGGIFSYNHPLEKYKRMTLTREEKDEIVRRDAASFIAAKLWGASLIEVGFVEGRAHFTFADHLKLWDLLSLGGLFVTGYGDSDSHSSSTGWYSGHNFAAWIAADAATPFPVPEEEFIASMKAGRLYTGDPVYIKGTVDFTSEGCPMGAILPVADRDKSPRTAAFSIDAGEGWTVRLIGNGDVIHEEITAGGLYTCTGSLKPDRPVNFIRAEVYNADGRCILLTNPVYFVRCAEFAGELPAERLYSKEGIQ